MTSADLLPHLEAAGLTVGAARMTPLTGGVSSDISLVESSSGTLVVKAALEELRVKDDWFADVSRNRVQQDVFHAAADIMKRRGTLAGVADEGGYWPVFDRNEDVIDALIAAIERAGTRRGAKSVSRSTSRPPICIATVYTRSDWSSAASPRKSLRRS